MKSLPEHRRLWELSTVIYQYESCSLFKVFTSQVSHLCVLSDDFIHISKLGIRILRVIMECFHLPKKWVCLDDFRWAFNLKTCHRSWWNGCRNFVYKEQVACVGKMNAFMYHSVQNLHGSFKILQHHLSKGTCPELCVWLQTYLQSCLPSCRILLFQYLE